MSILCDIAKFATDVLLGIFNNEYSDNDELSYDYEEITYDYWIHLSWQDQQDYFKNNLVLQQYGENYRYDDRHQMAKSVANIARLEHRVFNNKYDRY